jgi:hypothetical protein
VELCESVAADRFDDRARRKSLGLGHETSLRSRPGDVEQGQMASDNHRTNCRPTI